MVLCTRACVVLSLLAFHLPQVFSRRVNTVVDGNSIYQVFDRKSSLNTEANETDEVKETEEDFCNWDVRIRSEITYTNGTATNGSDIHTLRDVQLALSKTVGIFVVSKVSGACTYTYRVQCNAGSVILEKQTKFSSSPSCDTSKDGPRDFNFVSTRRSCLEPGESFVPLYWLAETTKSLKTDENARTCLVFEVVRPQADADASANENAVTPDVANHAHDLISRACVFDFSEQFPLSTSDLHGAVAEAASEYDWASTTDAAAINGDGEPMCIEESPDGESQKLVSCARDMGLRLLIVNLWNLKKMKSSSQFGGFSTVLTHNLQFFESVVQRTGFSVSRAESICMSRALKNTASPSDLRRCVVESLGKEPDELKNIAEIEDEIEMQSVWTKEKLRVNDIDLSGAEGEQARLHWHWAENDAEGYRLYAAAFDTCKIRMKHSTRNKEAMVMARLAQELTSACSKDKGCKVQSGGPLCPEGHGCLCSRPWTPKRGAVAGAAFFAASWPTYAALGALGGLIVAGPVGAAHGAIIGLALPGKFEGAGAMGLLFSRSWSKECMCFPLECKYDSASASCTLQKQSEQHASDPFDWLPYPGQKCVTKEHTHFYEGSGPACEMKSCSRSDYSEAVPTANGTVLFGKVGQRDGAVFNCPSIDGSPVGSFIVQDQLPQPHLGAGAKAPNTVESRLSLLRQYYLKGANETVLDIAED